MERKDNIITYVRFLGHLSFRKMPFNEIDALIFSMLSYFDWKSIVSSNENTISLEDAYNELLYLEVGNVEYEQKRIVKDEEERDVFLMEDKPKRRAHHNAKDYERELLYEMATSPRFKHIKLSHFIEESDYEQAKQFAALHIQYTPFSTFIAFRGTDDTLVGWKENWTMIYKEPVPGQVRAVKYVEESAHKHFMHYLLGGHSKGGNLALYAAFHMNEKQLRKIKAIYNFDGPGFRSPFEESERYHLIKERIHSYTPYFSLVGMALDHYRKDKTVQSFAQGLSQHDGYTWIVNGSSFLTTKKRDKESQRVEKTFKTWIHSIPLDEREPFVEVLFEVLEKANIVTMTDFLNMNIPHIAAIVKSMITISSDKRDLILKILRMLYQENHRNKKRTK